MSNNILSTITYSRLLIAKHQLFGFVISILSFLLISSSSFGQHKGFSLSTVSVRIYDASASVLSEINKVPDIERRSVLIGSELSQSDFDDVCSRLKWITKLSVENSHDISDLSSVRKLKDLESFQLKKCSPGKPISLLPLSDVETLKRLFVISTEVVDYESLGALTQLEEISFEKSPITSLDFLASMTQLKSLNVMGANHTFQNYDTLAKLQQLTYLNVSGNPQATSDNLDIFSDVSTLTKVDVSDCDHLKSLGFLYSCVGRLQEFYAVGCDSISNFDALIRASKLKKVDISNSKAKNISFLKNKLNMKELRIHGTLVQSIEELSVCENMEMLDISNTNVSDISTLSVMSKLKRLNISGTLVDSVSALSGCPSLVWFDGSSAGNLTSLEGMEACEKLNKIYLGHTQVRNLRPLYAAKKISYIQVDEDVPQVHLEALKRRSPLIVIDKVKIAPLPENENTESEESVLSE